ncbi:MAG: DUF1848 domain-containing protein [Proteobacteria bacterium]|nr:DUF1848 domain-containing protein [Pseudomonadota bacterium]
MIVSASYRTDIPAFFAPWFLGRLEAGFCRVANPYGGPPYTVSLRPGAVDGFVFWTRNAAPFADALAEVRRRGHPFVVQFTLTGYPRALERSVPAIEAGIAQMREVARRYGPRAVVWRYDPILVTSLTPADWHAAHFAALARRLRGVSDEVVTSFAQIYRKTARNLARAARAHGFDWRDPGAEDKRALLLRLAEAAAGCAMRLTLCTQPALADAGLPAAACIDGARLADIAGRPIRARRKGNRPGCLCAESRDIGAYDTCPQGCVYCYAVESRAAARRGLRAHDPAGAALVPLARRPQALPS